MFEEKTLEQRVDSLEFILAEFMMETRYNLRRLTTEMKQFKDEMKEFKDEMKEFKDEMKEFKTGAEKDRRNMNKQWGELTNKMGTIVEDIISPAVRPVIQKYFKEDIIDFSVNRKKNNKELNLKGEFDVIAVTNTSVYLVEVKSTPRATYLSDFNDNIEKFKKLFPEFRNLKLIPVFASLRFEEDFIEKINEYSFYAMAYKEWEYMDILNFDALKL